MDSDPKTLLTKAEYALSLKNVSKSFGSVCANRNISIDILKGTIHGIIGENGAGKSTLMSIIYGFYQADSGDILINGKKVVIENSLQAIELGIGMVHQHFMLVEPFSVVENVILGAENSAMISSTIDHAYQVLNDLNVRYGLYVDPDAIVADLPVGSRQRVEILKALYRKSTVLILDEPTGVLTPQESAQLFNVLKALKTEGVSVIIITHKLREVMAITDHVSVMRQGEMVAHRKTSETNMEELAELMVGRKVRLKLEKKEAVLKDVFATMSGLTVKDSQGVSRLKNINLEIRSGEILGVAGVSGNGQSELIEVLAGMQSIENGEMKINSHLFNKKKQPNAAVMRQIGVAHVPEDRLKHGLVKNFTALENTILGFQRDLRWNRLGMIVKKEVLTWCQMLMKKWDVRPPISGLRSANFSGGNQQKLIIAREVEQNPSLLLIGQPTRGVDIGAIEFIHNRILEQRDKGCAVLLVSVELDEIMALSDRIIVLFDGEIVGEIDAKDADEKLLGLMMANAHTRVIKDKPIGAEL